MGTECKESCVPREHSPKGIHCKGGSTSQVNKLVQSVFSPQTSECFLDEPMYTGCRLPWWNGRRLCTSLKLVANLATITVEYLTYQKQRPLLSPQCGTIPWRSQPNIWWQLDHGGLLPGGAAICPYSTKHIFWVMDLSSLTLIFLPASSYVMYRMPYSPWWYSAKRCSWSKNLVYSKRSTAMILCS